MPELCAAGGETRLLVIVRRLLRVIRYGSRELLRLISLILREEGNHRYPFPVVAPVVQYDRIRIQVLQLDFIRVRHAVHLIVEHVLLRDRLYLYTHTHTRTFIFSYSLSFITYEHTGQCIRQGQEETALACELSVYRLFFFYFV